MGKRVLVAVVFLPLIPIIIFVLPPVYVPICISILSAIAVHEVLWSTGFVKNSIISGLSIALAGCIPFLVFFDATRKVVLCFLFCYITAIFLVAITSKYTVTMEKMGGSFFFSLFVPYFLSSLVRLDQMPRGKFLTLLPLIVAFSSDIFALFGGMLFGKHKLAPTLSPKKTIEGSIGGFVGSILCTMLFGFVLARFFGFAVSYSRLAVYGLLGSAVSQLGDLFFSYIKRQYGIKDYGNIFPGHGGVLDRFDSVIFCAPLIELLLHILPAL
ncbi:hypothetical protein SDC9_55615 [bioreactor metagenome]|uniref:Phosphatidate cytidylyltransferase n=1 Tax=bioreactor metagenome TaxID=1076179 RepID=A0A644WZM6_9ZZZZ